MGDVELFRLSTSTPDHTLVHGAAVLYGTAGAHATFRRGIDIAAGFDIVGRAEASVGKELAFALTAGLDVTGTLAVQAAVPLDLFKAAGIIAKLHAEVGGDVYAAATLTLTRNLLKAKVLKELPADLAPFINAIIDELDLNAGLWARASFAAEVLGQASLTGALFGPQPGFTFDFRYDAALTFGAGTSFQVNVGLQNPDRMVARLADAAAALLLAKCGINDKQAPPVTGTAADQILSELDPKNLAAAAANTLVPMGLRSVMGVGVSLLEPSATRVDKTLGAVATALLDQARQQLLTAAHDAAISALQAELTSLGLTRLAANITDAQRGQLAQAFDDLADAIAKLEDTSPADAAVWLAAFAAILDPLDRILGFGFIPDNILKPITKAVAVLWSAAVVLGRVATVASARAGTVTGGLFPATAAQPAAPPDVAALIRPGGNVSYADTVSYLLKVSDIDHLLVSVIPQFGPVEAWLRRVLGTDASSLFVLLLSDLVAPSSAQNSQLVDVLGKVAADVIDNEVVPNLLTPLKAAHPGDEGVAILVDDVAVPALTALPRVVLPALASGHDDDVAVRLRETLSAVVLHAINQTMIPAIRGLLEHALDNGEASLRKVAGDELAQGTASATHNLFDDFQSLFLTPEDIAGVLNLGADTLSNLHDNVLDPSVDVVSAVLDLGLGKDAEAALKALATSDDPPPSADINGALDKVTSGAEETLKVVIPEAEDLVKTYFEHFGSRLEVVFEDGIAVVYSAVKSVRDELLKGVAELQHLLNDVIAPLIRQLASEIAADAHKLADDLRKEAQTVRTALRTQMINEITVATKGWPAWAQKAVIDLFTSLYDGLTFLPTMLEDALAGVLDDIADVLAAGVANSNGSRQAADDQVRGSAAAHCSQGMTFDLRVEVLGVTLFDLGTVRIAPGLIGTHVADTILGHAGYDTFMNTNLPKGEQIAQANSQAVAYQQRISGQVAQAQASQILDTMVTGADPTITVAAPAPASSFTDGTAVIIDIGGINATYLQTTLGVPPRVSTYLNGQPWYFPPDMWADPGDHTQKLWAQVVAYARPPLPAAADQAQTLTGDTSGTSGTVSSDGTSDGLAAGVTSLAATATALRRPVSAGRTVLERHDHTTDGFNLVLDPAALAGLSVGTDEHLARHAAAGTTPVGLADSTGRPAKKTTPAKKASRRVVTGKASVEEPRGGPVDLTGQLPPFAARGLLEAHQLSGAHPLAVANLTGRGVGGVDVDGPDTPPHYTPPHTGPTSPASPTGPAQAPATPRGLPIMVGKFGVNTLTVVVTDGQGRTAHASTTFTLAPASTVALQNRATNLMLDVSGGQGATGNGTTVFTWPWLHGTNQLWAATAEPSGVPGQPPMSTLVAAHSGLVLDVTGIPVQRAFTGQPGADVTLVPAGPGFTEVTHPTRGLLTGNPSANSPGSPVSMAPRKTDATGRTVPEQQWRTVPTAAFEAGARYLVHARHSGRYLDVRMDAPAAWGDGATLQQFDLNRGPNQRFQLYEAQPGEYMIFVEHSGRCLDAYFSGTANGTRVTLWNPHGGPNQRWRPEPTGGGWWRLANVNAGRVLDVTGVNPANGASLQLWDWVGGQNQQWMFDVDLDPDADVAGPLIAKHSGLVVDVPELSMAAGTPVQQWQSNGGANQRWRLKDAGNSAVTITALHSGLLLRPATVANGSPVLQAPPAGTDMDRWRVVPVEPGAVRLVHVGSGRVLDVTGGPTARGAGVGLQVHDWLDADNQKWRLPR